MIRKNFFTVKKGMAVALTAAVVMSQSVMVYAEVVLNQVVQQSEPKVYEEKQTATVYAPVEENEQTKDTVIANEGVAVSMTNGDATGVSANSENGTASVTVEKGVSATSNNNDVDRTRTVAINASSSGSEAKTEVIVNSGDTTATGTATENRIADATGIVTSARNDGGTVNVSTGTVTATTNKGTATGITVSTMESSEANVNISTGALTASSSNGVSQGIDATNYNGTVTITTGLVTSSTTAGQDSRAGGVSLETRGGTTTVNTGTIMATAAEGKATGLYNNSQYDSTNVNVTTGTIQAFGNAESTGVLTEVSFDSRLDITVNGDVRSNGTGIDLTNSHSGARVTVTNDVIASDTAVSLTNHGNGGSTTIRVDGTISGGEHNIVIEPGSSIEGLEVEVWKVDTSNGKEVIEQKHGDEYTELTNEYAIEAINYIIKVDGSNLTPDARTAHEGENVTLRVDVPSGYSIDSFYTAQGGTAVNVLQDSSGNYYIVVPRGGGVYVGVRLRSNGTSESSDRGDDNYRATSGGDSSVPNVNVGPKTVKVNGVEQKNDIHVASVSAEMKDAFAATLSTFAATGMVDLGGNNVSVPENAQIKDSFTFTADNAIGLVTAYIEFKNYKEGDIILCSYMDANGVLITVALTPDEIQNGAVILTLPAQCTLALAGNAGPVMGPLA